MEISCTIFSSNLILFLMRCQWVRAKNATKFPMSCEMDASIARRGQLGCVMRERRVDTNEWSEVERREGREGKFMKAMDNSR